VGKWRKFDPGAAADERLREIFAENVGTGGASAMKFIAMDIPG